MLARGAVAVGLLIYPVAPTSASESSGGPGSAYMCHRAKVSAGLMCRAGSQNEGIPCSNDADCGGGEGMCSKNKTTKADIPVVDPFDPHGPGSFKVNRPDLLCAPARTGASGARGDSGETSSYLESYFIKRSKEVRKHAGRIGVTLTNEFGEFTVATGKPDRLMMATQGGADVSHGVPDPASLDVDHYLCYQLLQTRRAEKSPTGIQATVDDEFHHSTYDLEYPTRLCNPVRVNREPIKNPAAHLLCYKAVPAQTIAGHAAERPIYRQRIEQRFNNWLAPQLLDTQRPVSLCLPSVMTANGTVSVADSWRPGL
ncbi:MAG: hypothetical protein ACE5FL_11570 [Myxococcota bacterium]